MRSLVLLTLTQLVYFYTSTTESFCPIVNKIPYSSTTTSSSSSYYTRLHADLITFDLDDTIFPVGPVVHDANEALICHLNQIGYDTITQESLISSTKYIRNELLKNNDKVITYTELRKRAICLEMNKCDNDNKNNHNGSSSNERKFTSEEVLKAYDIWETNRHLAAERHLYHDTIPMLQSLKQKYPLVTIGAITNGKGNPLHMKETIHEYFDFCISGEDDDVFPFRKPHEEIYRKSLIRYYNLRGIEAEKEKKSKVWIHVGDDLANDVGASAKCGAFAIWADLNDDEYNQSASKRFQDQTKKSSINTATNTSSSSSTQPFWSTATKDELDKRKKLNDESMSFVSAKIEKLSDLQSTIESIIASINTEEITNKYR